LADRVGRTFPSPGLRGRGSVRCGVKSGGRGAPSGASRRAPGGRPLRSRYRAGAPSGASWRAPGGRPLPLRSRYRAGALSGASRRAPGGRPLRSRYRAGAPLGKGGGAPPQEQVGIWLGLWWNLGTVRAVWYMWTYSTLRYVYPHTPSFYHGPNKRRLSTIPSFFSDGSQRLLLLEVLLAYRPSGPLFSHDRC